MDLRCGSSNSAPALQVWRPEFKSQSYHKKKKKVLPGSQFEASLGK
jgi:hypothetical protein